MTFLKKASVKDLIAKERDITAVNDDILNHYKEFELFLTQSDLNNSVDWKGFIREKLDGKGKIVAIHCPESNFTTSLDDEKSSNYLSLIEAIKDHSSFGHLKAVIELAKFLSKNSSASTADSTDDENDENGENKTNAPAKSNSSEEIFVIIHAGSLKGCGNYFDEEVSDEELEHFVNRISDCLSGTKVQILVENVTPYYTKKENSTGKNSGWGDFYFEDLDKGLLAELNKLIENKNKEKDNPAASAENTPKQAKTPAAKKIPSFGVCLDFCHLIADCKLVYKDRDISNYIENSVEKCANRVKLFHLSNLGEDYSHGALFSDDENDARIVDAILKICRKHPDVPITLEMADGADKRKACENFNRMVFRLSAIHKTGVLAEALDEDNCEELKVFFENMYTLFAAPWENRDLLRKSAFAVKKFMLDNGNRQNEETLPFGFTRDSGKEDLALLRVKAFTFYTRFAMLGEYLAGVYKQADFLTDWKKDFSDSIKYFIFADEEIKMCVYTGLAYSFMIDMLPRKITYYRFYDGIKDADIEKSVNYDIPGLFEAIRRQINGDKLTMYSCGKNFHQCMLKYGEENNDWSLRVYENRPINYIKLTEEERIISVPAFLYRYEYKDGKIPEYNFSIDVSSFRNGRDGDIGTLSELMNTLTGYNIIKENVGSISDGEIVSNELPDHTLQYKFTHRLDIHVLDNYIRKVMAHNNDREKYPFITSLRIEESNMQPLDLPNEDTARANKILFSMYNNIIKSIFRKYEIKQCERETTQIIPYNKKAWLPHVDVTFNEGEKEG